MGENAPLGVLPQPCLDVLLECLRHARKREDRLRAEIFAINRARASERGQNSATYAWDANKDGALQGGLSHQSSLVHRVLQAVARGWIIWILPRRKFVEMADGRRVVGGEQRAGLCHPMGGV